MWCPIHPISEDLNEALILHTEKLKQRTLKMGKMKQEPGNWAQCVEYIMYALNVLFFVIGGVTVGVGVWIVYEKDFMSRLFGTDLMTAAAYLIVAGGVSLVLFSFVGMFCGILPEQTNNSLVFCCHAAHVHGPSYWWNPRCSIPLAGWR
ncbi:hypothetical protein LSAT2_025444 [Lamellibrachia satsuma]|nr:hypothetical protein LSAT2_025444 [Lamellibrachia satsuma]